MLSALLTIYMILSFIPVYFCYGSDVNYCILIESMTKTKTVKTVMIIWKGTKWHKWGFGPGWKFVLCLFNLSLNRVDSLSVNAFFQERPAPHFNTWKLTAQWEVNSLLNSSSAEVMAMEQALLFAFSLPDLFSWSRDQTGKLLVTSQLLSHISIL